MLIQTFHTTFEVKKLKKNFLLQYLLCNYLPYIALGVTDRYTKIYICNIIYRYLLAKFTTST